MLDKVTNIILRWVSLGFLSAAISQLPPDAYGNWEFLLLAAIYLRVQSLNFRGPNHDDAE